MNLALGFNRNLTTKLHDFSITIYAVFHKASGEQTQKNICTSDHMYEKKVKFLYKLKLIQKVESKIQEHIWINNTFQDDFPQQLKLNTLHL